MDKKTIKVSVVAACYNVEKYIRECLDSITAQTLKEIEIVLVDDCSCDDTFLIISEYALKDKRIRVFRNNMEYKGAGNARNLGVKNATGKYILIIDADDFFESDMLDSLYERAEADGSDIVMFGASAYDDEYGLYMNYTTILNQMYLPDEGSFDPRDHADDLFMMTTGAAWSKLIRRLLIEENKLCFSNLSMNNDLLFVFSAMACAKKISIENYPFAIYRRNSGTSISDKRNKNVEDCLISLHELKKELIAKHMFEIFETGYLRRTLQFVTGAFVNMITDYEAFCKYYDLLKNKYLEKLGLDIMQKKAAATGFHYEKLLLIKEIDSPGKYLYELQNIEQKRKRFDLILPEGANILGYGYGKKGKEFYARAIKSNNITVVGWTDKRFEEIGYPLVSIEEALASRFDYCVITIEDPIIQETVKKDLIEWGIESKKILFKSYINWGASL